MSSYLDSEQVIIPSLIEYEGEDKIILSYWNRVKREKVQNFFSKIKKFSYLECKLIVDNSAFENFCVDNFYIRSEIDGKDLGINKKNYFDLDPEIGKSIYEAFINYFNNSMHGGSGDLYGNYIDILKGKHNGEVSREIKTYYISIATGIAIDEVEKFEDAKIDKLYNFTIMRDNFKNADIINAMSIIFGGKSIL